jgi:hypothetical protein
MGKDLKSTAFPLKIYRAPKLDGTIWSMKTMQPFFPCLEKLFKTENISGINEYGVRLSSPIDTIIDEKHVRVAGQIIPVHRKTTMILSPFKTMRGDYGAFGVPKRTDIADDMQERMQSPHTAAYVGAITSIALSESACVHFPKVYGVYAGLAGSHTIDISDDYEDLTEKGWFADKIGKTFELKLRTAGHDAEFSHTRRARVALETGEDVDLGDIEDVEADHVSNPDTEHPIEGYDVASSESPELEDDDSDEEDVYDIESCACSDGTNEEEGEEEEPEPFAWATFTDVPVVTTVMEVCEGTFYELVKIHPEPQKHVAWVSQIVFALAYAQRNFGFTHNDLHGNNVMYVKTDQTHCLYAYGGQAYKVPTFGYIMKIIDFDRSIVSLRLTGLKEAKMFMSSQFQEDEEAGGQYNMEPFYDNKHPHISASSSFDLVRFATSVFWDMFPKGPKEDNKHPLFAIFLQWMKQTDGTSVMFRAKMDNHDRYHGFDLYKAIVRYCVDTAVPKKEISRMVQYRATPSAAQLGDALVIDI